jgi:phosphatidate cytidylyltransferase
MTRSADPALVAMIGGVMALLVGASIITWILGRRVTSVPGRARLAEVDARVRAWWVMALLFVVAVTSRRAVPIALFAVVSLLALREFVTLVPTRLADHRTLFYAFFVVIPLQYSLIWLQFYGLFAIMIPVYVSMFLAIRTVLAGDTHAFLERTAATQSALMICVYFVSYVPALQMLRIPGYERAPPKLMFFLVLIVELSDVLQYLWGKSVGKRPIAPGISPNKTWEGFVGGVACASALGAATWWATPFSPGIAGVMALVITLAGFAGGLIMSAIKRDRGIKDFGCLIQGHGGVLDRIDSLCFAAPVFFHLTRYFYAR